jgi:ketosteroid isomerase-like protein
MTNFDDVRLAIERHNANAVRWYAAGDVDSLVSIFAEHAWQMPPHSPPLVGRTAIRDFWRNAVSWGKWEFILETKSVDASGPIAVERGKYVLRFTAGSGAPAGMSSFEDRGNYLVHWRQEADKQWRVVADAPVSELPLQDAGIGDT